MFCLFVCCCCRCFVVVVFFVYSQGELYMNERVQLIIGLSFDMTIPFPMINTDCHKHTMLLKVSSHG